MEKIWSYHKAHHYFNSYAAFGVSTRLWDFMFGILMNKFANGIEKAESWNLIV